MAEGTPENPAFDLLAAFKARFGLDDATTEPATPTTGVLASAQHIYDNAIDVSISMGGTRIAADRICTLMQAANYSAASPGAAWAKHELHPKVDEMGVQGCVDFCFTMDLLNFCFWSDRADGDERRFAIEYQGKRWTGYWSLVAGLRRALDEGVSITSSDFWQSEEECTLDTLKNVFRSATEDEMPLLEERLNVLREAGRVLYDHFECSAINIVKKADGSAARLVNLLAEYFPSFRDTSRFEDEKVKFLKRAQILVADLWACFDGGLLEETGLFDFDDIDELTTFPDYRIPQMLHTLGCISYSPPLDSLIRRKMPLESGHSWEIQIRGCSIWAVELITREIKKQQPASDINAIVIDFWLYDTVKQMEAEGEEQIPHHRTRSIWY